MDRDTLPRAFDDLWHAHRAHLLDLATRMLGDRAGAEDVVQEAYGRLARADRDAIDDVGGWLAVVVRRLCLDRIRSAVVRRERLADPASPPSPGTPALAGPAAASDPADRVTLDDQVRAALAVVLDRLTPGERTAFVLHDVFGFPFAAVGEIVGRTPAACRQLASRARQAIRSGRPRPRPAGAAAHRHREVAERFVAACAGGDIAALMAVLDPDVDGGAVLLGYGPLLEAAGRAEVAERLVALFGPGSPRRLAAVPLGPGGGAVAYDVARGRVVAVVRLDVAGERVRHIHAFVRSPGELAGTG